MLEDDIESTTWGKTYRTAPATQPLPQRSGVRVATRCSNPSQLNSILRPLKPKAVLCQGRQASGAKRCLRIIRGVFAAVLGGCMSPTPFKADSTRWPAWTCGRRAKASWTRLQSVAHKRVQRAWTFADGRSRPVWPVPNGRERGLLRDTVQPLPALPFVAASRQDCFDKGVTQAGQRNAFVSYKESTKQCCNGRELNCGGATCGKYSYAQLKAMENQADPNGSANQNCQNGNESKCREDSRLKGCCPQCKGRCNDNGMITCAWEAFAQTNEHCKLV